MWWELTWDDIIWDNLDEKIVREKGVKKWGSKGINVYQFDREYKHNLQRHRFAVFPPEGEKVSRNSMRPDRYYVHVYQTKIKKADGVVCWLRSKEIAQVLNKKWWQTYYPRDRDFPNPTEKKRLRRPSEPANHRKFLSRRSHGIRSKQSRRRENARQLGKHTGRYWNGRQNVFKDYHPRRIDSKQRNSPRGHLTNSYKKQKLSRQASVQRITQQFSENIENLSKSLQRLTAEAKRLKAYADF